MTLAPSFTPWRDRAGRVSALRIVTLAVMILPALRLFQLWAMSELGPEPLEAATHETGHWAIRLLIASLAVTPLGRILGWPRLFQLRRMIGLGALAWVLLHFTLYIGDQNWRLWRVAIEIVSRVYLIIGFTALLGLLVLGWTSTDGWMKRLGQGWKKLHRIVFPVALLGLLHAFIQSKTDVSNAVLLAGLLAWLLAWRALPGRWQTSLPALALLSIAALFSAVLIEFLWYALATNLPAARISAANLDVSFGPRPAVLSGIIAAGFVLLAALRRLAGRQRAA
ncbi:ferric reductase-like transmembrane domain-containing protein [Sediminicoccus sp. KRV36]|uniref:sulfite oxidase heme-binding subunit YedZ n=1 Tax=Sediminicoccus sp. KRV36 TaxID=3133721 RepID=UPI00200CCD99|nr:ferric reductase-like transmembrane domain-containing protein [Sediminicoccus rosea]UPY39178.1 ferric reductase-like transmembrane domain-containing protein [Sediminicoccus rosea]